MHILSSKYLLGNTIFPKIAPLFSSPIPQPLFISLQWQPHEIAQAVTIILIVENYEVNKKEVLAHVNFACAEAQK
jgi:hypothetical protein